MKNIKSAIIGVAGLELSADEIALMQDHNPLGVILFARNCQSQGQLRALTASIRHVLARADAPILVDQEGGRVQRLTAPHWPKLPAAAQIGALYDRDPSRALKAASLLGQVLGQELADIGINVDCAPVVDLAHANTHKVIGDRAFHPDPEIVYRLAQQIIHAMAQFGVLAVIKHAPGHGRSLVDSHLELPYIHCTQPELMVSDFLPFAKFGQESANLPAWVMTAHIVYDAMDATHPATCSPIMIGEILRGKLGIDLPILSDDLGMNALHQSVSTNKTAKQNIALDPTHYAAGENPRDWEKLVKQCLAAGCDIVLICRGELAETRAVLQATPFLTDQTMVRLDRAWRNLPVKLAAPGDDVKKNIFAQADLLWQMIA